jgi:hypothetical protein
MSFHILKTPKEAPAFQEVLQKTLQRFSSGTAKATRSSHNTVTKCMLQSQLLLNQDASLSGERRNNVQKNCLKPFAKPSVLSKRRLQYLGGGVKENPNKSSTKTTATATTRKKTLNRRRNYQRKVENKLFTSSTWKQQERRRLQTSENRDGGSATTAAGGSAPSERKAKQQRA